jgi:hypothetical protein
MVKQLGIKIDNHIISMPTVFVYTQSEGLVPYDPDLEKSYIYLMRKSYVRIKAIIINHNDITLGLLIYRYFS